MVSFASRPGSIYPKTVSATSLIPDELIRLDQWVCWRYNRDKSKKPPVDPQTGRSIDWTDPGRWLSYSDAQEHAHDGVGFVLTPDDPFTFIDLDNVIDPETGEIEPWAMRIVETVGSYTEISPSGRGLRIAVLGKLPITKKGAPPVEIFSQRGYVTITGEALAGFAGPVVEAQDALEDLYRKHCQPAPSQAVEVASHEPLPDPIDLTDADLLDKARNAEFGREFVTLFDVGDMSSFNNDHHRADYALMRQLRYWTQADPDRMERLFSESILGQRDKWRSRPPYRRDTITKALKAGGKVYEPEKHRPNKTRVRDRLPRLALYAHLVHPWGEITGSARSASTDYFVYLSVLRRAHKANTLEVDFSERDCKDENGIGNLETAAQSLARLQDLHRLVEKVRDGNHGNAARYRIKKVSIPDHIEIGGVSLQLNPPCVDRTCDPLLSPEGFGPWLIRHPSPATEKTHDRNGRPIPQATGDSLRSLGKPAAMALNIAHIVTQLTGRPAPARFLASRLGSKTKNFKPRQGKDLVSAGLLEESEDGKGYRVPEDVGANLERELRDSGALRRRADGLDRTATARRHQRIRKLWWLGMNQEKIAVVTGFDPDEITFVVTPPDEAPTEAEMDAARLAKSAHGEIAELAPESMTWTGTYPRPDDSQQPLGHEPQEAPQDLVSAPELVQRPTAQPDDTETAETILEGPDDEPCKHSGLGHVYPGGRGCYCCDDTHPYRQQQPAVIDLKEYRRNRVA